MPEQIAVGETRIIVHGDDFVRGMEAGHRLFITTRKGRLLTDIQIFCFLDRCMSDPLHHNNYKSGFVVGWIQALVGVPLEGNEEGNRE